MYNKLSLFSLLAILVLSSCSKDLPDPGATNAVKMANEWWVTLTVDGADVYNLGHKQIATYNTSANSDSIWVDDYENLWDFKCKALANYSDLTFSTTNAQNEYYDITVNLKNGKIFPGMGVSKTGNVTDSIYMEAEFSDDPGTTYVISGHARTRWRDDDY
jgi:hypothetical protein